MKLLIIEDSASLRRSLRIGLANLGFAVDSVMTVANKDFVEDNPVAAPRKIGVRIWAGYSYLRPWSYLVDRWLDATKNAKAGK